MAQNKGSRSGKGTIGKNKNGGNYAKGSKGSTARRGAGRRTNERPPFVPPSNSAPQPPPPMWDQSMAQQLSGDYVQRQGRQGWQDRQNLQSQRSGHIRQGQARPNGKDAGFGGAQNMHSHTMRQGVPGGNASEQQSRQRTNGSTPNTRANSSAKSKAKSRSQTPPRGKGGRPGGNAKPQKRKLTPDELEARRLDAERLEAKRKAERKRLRELQRRALEVLLARMILFLCMFGAVFICSTAFLLLSAFTGNSPSAKPFTLKTVQSIASVDTPPETETVSGSRTLINGECYINFSKLTSLYGYIMTGDRGEYSFLADIDGTQSVTFKVGSGEFEINGVKGRFSDPVMLFDDDIYVPTYFINSYMNGLSVSCDIDNRVMILTRENDSKLDSFVEPSFTLQSDSPNTHVSEGSLDDDILLMTAPYRTSEIIDNYIDTTVTTQ